MKKLINLSNHPSANWELEQKAGWDEIIDIPFPNVAPNASEEEVIELAAELLKKIKNTGVKNIMLQGEFTLVFALQQMLIEEGFYNFFFPTTERKVVEQNGIKTSVFKFVRWREMGFHKRVVFNIDDGILQTVGANVHSINEQIEWAKENGFDIKVKSVEGVFDIPFTDEETEEIEDIWS